MDARYNCFLITLQYQGTHYAGWQRQALGGPVTVQLLLEEALGKLIQKTGIKSVASSRTDSGVHAVAQQVKVVLPMELPLRAIIKGVNKFLPSDIRVIDAIPIEETFHPIRAACWKEYRYFFYVGTRRAVCYDWLTPWAIDGDVLDFKAMQEAASCFVGDHIFHNFYCEGTPVKSFRRKIYECELSYLQQGLSPIDMGGAYYCFRVIGRGFLKQMVRLMVGTIWEVGLQKVTLGQLASALRGEMPPKVRLGPVAPAQGLYLHKISFTPWTSAGL